MYNIINIIIIAAEQLYITLKMVFEAHLHKGNVGFSLL